MVTIYYGTRRLPGGKFGIHVLTYRDGSLETEDMNTTPWATREIALERAKFIALMYASKETADKVLPLE